MDLEDILKQKGCRFYDFNEEIEKLKKVLKEHTYDKYLKSLLDSVQLVPVAKYYSEEREGEKTIMSHSFLLFTGVDFVYVPYHITEKGVFVKDEISVFHDVKDFLNLVADLYSQYISQDLKRSFINKSNIIIHYDLLKLFEGKPRETYLYYYVNPKVAEKISSIIKENVEKLKKESKILEKFGFYKDVEVSEEDRKLLERIIKVTKDPFYEQTTSFMADYNYIKETLLQNKDASPIKKLRALNYLDTINYLLNTSLYELVSFESSVSDGKMFLKPFEKVNSEIVGKVISIMEMYPESTLFKNLARFLNYRAQKLEENFSKYQDWEFREVLKDIF